MTRRHRRDFLLDSDRRLLKAIGGAGNAFMALDIATAMRAGVLLSGGRVGRDDRHEAGASVAVLGTRARRHEVLDDQAPPGLDDGVDLVFGHGEAVVAQAEGDEAVPAAPQEARQLVGAERRADLAAVDGLLDLGPEAVDDRLQRARDALGEVVHAAHVGPVDAELPAAPVVPWKTQMLGETQICAADGSILARLRLEDGEDYVAADVTPGAVAPIDPLTDRFWVPVMPLSTHVAAWHVMNNHGRLDYKLRGKHEWQQFPAGDLPDELPPVADEQAQHFATTA